MVVVNNSLGKYTNKNDVSSAKSVRRWFRFFSNSQECDEESGVNNQKNEDLVLKFMPFSLLY